MDSKILLGLSLLIDEALANRMVEAERLKTAEARLRLYEREGHHMCITPGCRNPVVGKVIFAHCERHLEQYEMRWLEDEVENVPRVPPSESEHSAVTDMKQLIFQRDQELSEENALKKMQALDNARAILENARLQRVERRAYLPAELRRRIEEGWNDLNPTKVEDE